MSRCVSQICFTSNETKNYAKIIFPWWNERWIWKITKIQQNHWWIWRFSDMRVKIIENINEKIHIYLCRFLIQCNWIFFETAKRNFLKKSTCDEIKPLNKMKKKNYISSAVDILKNHQSFMIAINETVLRFLCFD